MLQPRRLEITNPREDALNRPVTQVVRLYRKGLIGSQKPNVDPSPGLLLAQISP